MLINIVVQQNIMLNGISHQRHIPIFKLRQFPYQLSLAKDIKSNSQHLPGIGGNIMPSSWWFHQKYWDDFELTSDNPAVKIKKNNLQIADGGLLIIYDIEINSTNTNFARLKLNYPYLFNLELEEDDCPQNDTESSLNAFMKKECDLNMKRDISHYKLSPLTRRFPTH